MLSSACNATDFGGYDYYTWCDRLGRSHGADVFVWGYSRIASILCRSGMLRPSKTGATMPGTEASLTKALCQSASIIEAKSGSLATRGRQFDFCYASPTHMNCPTADDLSGTVLFLSGLLKPSGIGVFVVPIAVDADFDCAYLWDIHRVTSLSVKLDDAGIYMEPMTTHKEAAYYCGSQYGNFSLAALIVTK